MGEAACERRGWHGCEVAIRGSVESRWDDVYRKFADGEGDRSLYFGGEGRGGVRADVHVSRISIRGSVGRVGKAPGGRCAGGCVPHGCAVYGRVEDEERDAQ